MNFLHSGDIGDIIYALPVIKAMGGGALYLADLPKITRPLTDAVYGAIAPLCAAQKYISKVARHNGEEIDVDFTEFRGCYSRARTLAEAQAMHCFGGYVDLTSPWLTVDKFEKHGRPVIARSPRYHNSEWDSIWPTILRGYPNAMFVGLKSEHDEFERQFGPVEYAPTKSLLEVAELIAGSSTFIGNQSSPFAVAEGLKHKRILEADTKTLDCIYEGGEVQHITSSKPKPPAEYVDRENEVLILALQFQPADVEQAEELLRLIADNESTMRSDVEFAVVGRHDVPDATITRLADIARRWCRVVHQERSKRFGTGWPSGPNDLWAETMRLMEKKYRNRKTHATAVLTFEADCIPLRCDWIDELTQEWSRRPDGVLAMGHVQGLHHINGNAIFDIGILEKIPALYGSSARIGWDVYHAKALMAVGLNTHAITQSYRIKSITAEQIAGIRKWGKRPALFHGLKNSCGIAPARELLGLSNCRLTSSKA